MNVRSYSAAALVVGVAILGSTLTAQAQPRPPHFPRPPMPHLPHPPVIHVPVPPVPHIVLPPPIVFSAPPQVVVLPGSNIYVAPDIDDDVYFVDGYWWRPYQGGWYRSRSYDNGWAAYSGVPGFYAEVRPGWRDDYHQHRWNGQPWQYERMPHQHVEKNWSSWKKNDHWKKNSHSGSGHYDKNYDKHDKNDHKDKHGGGKGKK